ncbi:MAG: S1 RNA-binding domain-containing protein, partial [Ardenticatenaceae bacterium]
NSHEGIEMSVNAAALAAAEPDGEVQFEAEPATESPEVLSVNAAALGTEETLDQAPARADGAAEETSGDYLPDSVAAEVPDATSSIIGDDLDAVAMEGIEESGEAAAVTTPKSEEEADAAIEAAGVAPAAEGRAPTPVEVTDDGVAEDVAAVEEMEDGGRRTEDEGRETEDGGAGGGEDVADAAVEEPSVRAEAVEAEEAPGATAPVAIDGEVEAAAPVEEEKKSRRRRKRRERKGRKLDSFQPGEELQGMVRSVQPYGAFVDVGAERDGLVHISELRDGFVDKVEDVVKTGEQVTVRVKEVDIGRGRLSLTMRAEQPATEEKPQQPQRIRLRDISEGQEFLGTVSSIVDFGAFVDIGATTDGLVHISEMSEGRVNRVTDVVKEGDEVKVRVLSVDKKRNRIGLTMKEQPEPEVIEYAEEESDDDLPSVMEAAFARARERSNKERRRDTRNEGRSNQADPLEDIITRTLRQHGSSG